MSTHGYVDLHVHTTASDGVFSAERVIEEASRARLEAIAVTDHDTVDAIPAALAAARRAGIRLIPGVELSAAHDGANVHILGYFLDADANGFRERLATFRDSRLERARRMVARLNALGVAVRLERVQEIAADAVVGRPHVAEAILERGYVDSFQGAFDRFIGTHAPAYVPRHVLGPGEAIRLIREAGGAASLAHPGTLRRDDLILGLVAAGLVAIEVWHPRHDPSRVRRYQALARELDLVATGGSDFHGGARGESSVGDQPVPGEVVAALARRAG